MNNFDFKVVHITEQYFRERTHFKKMLDPGDYSKQQRRRYLFLKIQYKGNNLMVPLRRNLGNPIKPYGVVGFSVPSSTRPNAGLDYRYILIVNDDRYLIEEQSDFSRAQQNIIRSNISIIEREVKSYVDSYVRMAKKERIHREAKFRESSLINFHEELKI